MAVMAREIARVSVARTAAAQLAMLSFSAMAVWDCNKRAGYRRLYHAKMPSKIKNPLSRNKSEVGATINVPKRGLNCVVHKAWSRIPATATSAMRLPIATSMNAAKGRRKGPSFAGLRLFQCAHLARFDMSSACGQSIALCPQPQPATANYVRRLSAPAEGACILSRGGSVIGWNAAATRASVTQPTDTTIRR